MISLLPRPRAATWLTVLLGIGTLPGGQSLAGPPPSGLADCATISDDQARLACYDSASGRVAATLAQPTPADSAASSEPTAPASSPDVASTQSSLIDSAWGFDPDSNRYTIALYRPNYLQVARWSSRPNNAPFQYLFDSAQAAAAELNSTEAQFQVSFKARLWTTNNRRFGLWAAYTQQSQWQVYNSELSRPFRENNYMPELMASYRPNLEFGGLHWRLFNIGYTHQSNGRADPISRRWDRLIAEFGIERGNFALLIRPWLVLGDGGNDNPGITDYYGYGDITAIYKWHGNSFSLMVRGNPATGKGAAEFSWSTPPLFGPLHGYVQAFTGYGDSLIDYNWQQTAVGLGVTLNDQL